MSTDFYIDFIEKIPGESEKSIYQEYSYDRIPYHEDVSFGKKESKLLADFFEKRKYENLKKGYYELTKGLHDEFRVCLTVEDINNIIEILKEIDDNFWIEKHIRELEYAKEYVKNYWIVMYWA